MFPPAGKVFLGIQTQQGPYDFTDTDAFATATGHTPAVLQFSQGWAHHGFDRKLFDAIADRHMLPLLSWEPWDYQAGGRAADNGQQPAYRLSRIINGEFDEYITSWAEGIKDLGYPVALRFGHEMNGNWYPWAEQVNGNRPGDYAKAYRRIHDLFRVAAATNVTWVWSPNVTYPGAQPLPGLYPGDSYVDWIGLSGYYGTPGVERYKSFADIFGGTLTQLRTFTSRPVVITETGATDAAGLRTEWVRQMFQQLPDYPQIIGVLWFEANRVVDWRIAATPRAARAFGDQASQPRYRVTWSPTSVTRHDTVGTGSR